MYGKERALVKHMRQMHLIADHGNVRQALEEFKELRRVNDGVGDRGFCDQFLLGDLGAEVAAFGKLLRPHDRQRNVMSHACGRFMSEEVTG
jgi:hypothetical protein